MYLIVPQQLNGLLLLNGKIYGSWNNWETPIKIKDYNFIYDDYYVFFIDTNASFSYKIKINGNYILIEDYLTVKEYIKNNLTEKFTNNKVNFDNNNKTDNGLFQTFETDNKLLIYKLNTMVAKYGMNLNNKQPEYTCVEYYDNGKFRYEGRIGKNKYNGHGNLYFNNGAKQYKGYFENGLFHEYGILYFENGDKHYQGEFKNGKMHGKCDYYYINGKEFIKGRAMNGKVEGTRYCKHENRFCIQCDLLCCFT